MSSREFKQWKVYNRISPIGSWREDFRVGILAAVIANGQRTKSSDKIAKPSDFIPEFYVSRLENERRMNEQIAQFMSSNGAPASPR